jgi:hypothetical protein
MDVEHFGLLSSVFRKTESHEQDGERLPRAFALETASGDPAMALRSSIRFARTDLSVRHSSAAQEPPTQWRATSPPTARAEKSAREND